MARGLQLKRIIKFEKAKQFFENLLIEVFETSMKLKNTPVDVFLCSAHPSPLDFQSCSPPPVRFSSMPSVVGAWIFSGITHCLFFVSLCAPKIRVSFESQMEKIIILSFVLLACGKCQSKYFFFIEPHVFCSLI